MGQRTTWESWVSPFKNYMESGNQLMSSRGPLSFTFRADFSKIVRLVYGYTLKIEVIISFVGKGLLCS